MIGTLQHKKLEEASLFYECKKRSRSQLNEFQLTARTLVDPFYFQKKTYNMCFRSHFNIIFPQFYTVVACLPQKPPHQHKQNIHKTSQQSQLYWGKKKKQKLWNSRGGAERRLTKQTSSLCATKWLVESSRGFPFPSGIPHRNPFACSRRWFLFATCWGHSGNQKGVVTFFCKFLVSHLFEHPLTLEWLSFVLIG